jgi:hypothetical protein
VVVVLLLVVLLAMLLLRRTWCRRRVYVYQHGSGSRFEGDGVAGVRMADCTSRVQTVVQRFGTRRHCSPNTSTSEDQTL